MRADRLLSIMLLLQVYNRLTARELAQRLEVSERTIHRDMDALSTAGVPVVAERGVGGGWSLLESYRTNLTGLNTAEIQTLFLAPPSHLLSDLGLQKAAEGALIKLLAAIPQLHRQNAELVRERLHVDGAGWHLKDAEDVSALPLLQEAVWQQRRVRTMYAREEDDLAERLMEPLGLVAKGTAWYLTARVDDDIRSYRVSRIKEVTLTEERFERPADFRLAEFWEASQKEFVRTLPRYNVVIRVHPDIFWRLRWIGRFSKIDRTDPPDDTGWRTVHMRFQFDYEAVETLVGFGAHVKVLEPPGLGDMILQRAKEAVAFYEAMGKEMGGEEINT